LTAIWAYYTKQNYWSVGDLGKDWDCPSRWNNGQYQDAPYPKLFLFNHYRNVPTVGTAALDNTYEKIMDRIDNRCAQTAKQLPNFVGVDFYELPANYRKAGDVVAEINKRFSNG
jgi:chitinase